MRGATTKHMRRIGTWALLLASLLLSSLGQAAQIVRISGKDPNVLTTPDVKTEEKDGQIVKRRQMSQSADKAFQSGICSMQIYNEDIASYPVDEFIFALEGKAKLTSADGTVLEVTSGDALFIPKGWNGRWETNGFKEVYVIYSPEKPVEPANGSAATAPHPRKISSTDNLALTTADVKTHDIFKYRVLGKSADGNFRAGFSSMRSKRGMETGSDVDEVLIMVDGSETFTSPDGSVVKTIPGDVAFMPKGWKGHYSTEGYQEIYVIYGPECMVQNNC